MGRSLKSLGVQNGSQLDCDDFKQQLAFKLLIFNSDKLTDDEFEIDVGEEKDINRNDLETPADNELEYAQKTGGWNALIYEYVRFSFLGINLKTIPDIDGCSPTKRSRIE